MRLLSKTLAVLSIAWLASSGAQAKSCKEIDTFISTSYFVQGCTSPVALCTAGTVAFGPLAGTTRFTALTAAPGATPYQFFYTGELVITTRSGSVTLHDFGFFDAMAGKYSELQQIVAGTKKFKNATGTLSSAGLGDAAGFSGTLTGTICRAEDDEDDGDRAQEAE
jgi:hypothetical protein